MKGRKRTNNTVISMAGTDAQVLHLGRGDDGRTLLVLDSLTAEVTIDIPMDVENFVHEINQLEEQREY